MVKYRGLGKGLDALFTETVPEGTDTTGEEGTGAFTLRLSDIEPDRTQPRRNFDADALASLADSITRHGILQPLVVRKAPLPEEENSPAARILAGKYKIISGERRWRAAKMAGLTEVPVVIKDITESEIAAIMLVENLQREDLNPVEEARGLSRLIDEYLLTQEQAAAIVGISRSALANALRLLALPDDTLAFLEAGELTAGHARALLTINDASEIEGTAKTVVAKGLSVRETEKLCRSLNAKHSDTNAPAPEKQDISLSAYLDRLEEKVSSSLGRKTRIVKGKNNKQSGKLELEYYDREDLETLLSSLCGSDVFGE